MNFYNGFSPAQRIKALNWSKAQRAAGRRKPKAEKCMACGQEHGLIQFHSEDYSEPYGPHIGAYEFCYRCHMTLHCRFSSHTAWEKYKEFLRAGYRWEPIHGSNFDLIRRFLGQPKPPAEKGEPRPVLIFDQMGI